MNSVNTPHEANDELKLKSMISTLKSGNKLPAILVHNGQAYSGSHRIEAHKILDLEIEVVELIDNEFYEICNELSIDPIYDEITDFEYFFDEAKSLGFTGNSA